MTAIVWLAIGLGLLSLAVYRAGRVWLDAGPLAPGPGPRIRWTLLGTALPERYWWRRRIEALPGEDRKGFLVRETAALGLGRADAERCPLCRDEIPGAWTLTAGKQAGREAAAIAAGPVQCPSCDFRLDACRHCTRFAPGGPRDWGHWTWEGGDLSSGRCTHYRSVQPVDVACAPSMARQLRRRGYEQIRAPLPIVDSYLPPDSCRAFRPDPKRLRASGVRWPGARRTALLRLLQAAPERKAGRPAGHDLDQSMPGTEEGWLL
jgi:hypothetical protein